MLQIIVPKTEFFNEKTCEFINVKEHTLTLEHSLVSISKWESKYKKPFLTKKKEDDKTPEELLHYIKCMTITQNVDPMVYMCLTTENIKAIQEYIEDPMTATWFKKREGSGVNRDIITSEVIYYQMIELGIPFECQKWHINRLLTLILVCQEKMGKQKKMSKRDMQQQYRTLNAERRAKMNSKG